MWIVILTKIFMFVGIIWYHMIPLPFSPLFSVTRQVWAIPNIFQNVCGRLPPITAWIQKFKIKKFEGGIYLVFAPVEQMFSNMSDSEEQDCNSIDDEDLMHVLFLNRAVNTFLPAEKEKRQRRRQRWIHKRLNWAEHVRKLGHEHAFDRTYRMSVTAFCNC